MGNSILLTPQGKHNALVAALALGALLVFALSSPSSDGSPNFSAFHELERDSLQKALEACHADILKAHQVIQSEPHVAMIFAQTARTRAKTLLDVPVSLPKWRAAFQDCVQSADAVSNRVASLSPSKAR